MIYIYKIIYIKYIFIITCIDVHIYTYICTYIYNIDVHIYIMSLCNALVCILFIEFEKGAY